MNTKHYIPQALVTCSTSFHSDKVAADNLIEGLEAVYVAGDNLDSLKKAVFYGKGESTRENGVGAEHILQYISPDRAKAIQILHGVVGCATEVGEMAEAVTKAYDEGVPVDLVNLKEEMGDILWYMAILMDALGTNFETEMARNIAKLRQRYGEKFSEFDANNRNLDAERGQLELLDEGQEHY